MGHQAVFSFAGIRETQTYQASSMENLEWPSHFQLFDNVRICFQRWWSWGELNPRPDKAHISFLHAYLQFGFKMIVSTATTVIIRFPELSASGRDIPLA